MRLGGRSTGAAGHEPEPSGAPGSVGSAALIARRTMCRALIDNVDPDGERADLTWRSRALPARGFTLQQHHALDLPPCRPRSVLWLKRRPQGCTDFHQLSR
jgi:hypothetical protein